MQSQAMLTGGPWRSKSGEARRPERQPARAAGSLVNLQVWQSTGGRL